MIKEFKYHFRINRSIIVLMIIALASFLIVKFNTKALMLYRIIKLTPSQARGLFIGIGVFMLIVSLLFIVGSTFCKKTLVVHENGIFIPNPLTSKVSSIYIKHIVKITEHDFGKVKLATIHTRDNKEHSIISTCLDSDEEYKELLSVLRTNMKS